MQILQTIFLYIVPFVLVLGMVVTIHELGHFLAAKWLGTKIDRFSLGFGRPIAAWTDRSGVEWRLGWAPIGGYVRFAGDENAASIPDAEDLSAMRRQLVSEGRGAEISRYFHFKPLWQRAIIEHREIFEAVKSGDAKAARAAMRSHILAAGADMDLPALKTKTAK